MGKFTIYWKKVPSICQATQSKSLLWVYLIVWSQFTELSKFKKNPINLLRMYLSGSFKKHLYDMSYLVNWKFLAVNFKSMSSKPENMCKLWNYSQFTHVLWFTWRAFKIYWKKLSVYQIWHVLKVFFEWATQVHSQ